MLFESAKHPAAVLPDMRSHMETSLLAEGRGEGQRCCTFLCTHPANVMSGLVQEGELVYDYAWYSGMSAADPASCCFATTCRVRQSGAICCTVQTIHAGSLCTSGEKLYLLHVVSPEAD